MLRRLALLAAFFVLVFVVSSTAMVPRATAGGVERWVDPSAASADPGTGCGAQAAYTTIQAAIDAAGENDTVTVCDGTYAEQVEIGKEHLTVRSVNGPENTTIQPVSPNPRVLILSDYVTFGGPGQGFTLDTEAPTAMEIDGNLAGANTVFIEGNIFLGDEANHGIIVFPGLNEAHLVIRGNEFVPGAGSCFSFHHVILVDGGKAGLASQSSELEIEDNVVEDFGGAGVFVNGDIVDSTVRIERLEAHAADLTACAARSPQGFGGGDARYGIFLLSVVEEESTLEILDNTITGISTSFENGGFREGSATWEDWAHTVRATAGDATIQGGIGDANTGIFVGILESGSTAEITNNELDLDGADAGVIVFGVNDESRLRIANNMISGYCGLGVVTLFVQESDYRVEFNNVSGHEECSAGLGVLVVGVEESTAKILANTIDGFCGLGIMVIYLIGSEAQVSHNDVQGSADCEFEKFRLRETAGGGEQAFDGVLIGTVVETSTIHVIRNCIGSVEFGLLVGALEEGSALNAHQNDLEDTSVGIWHDPQAKERSAAGLGDPDIETGTVNGINNWWGAADGPSGDGPGSGSEVIGDVDFDPWMEEPTPCGLPDPLLWGDADCNGDVLIGDALKTARYLLGLSVSQDDPCPELGADIEADGLPQIWGDVDCDGNVVIGDALKIARFLLGLSVSQTEPCPDIGEEVQVIGF